MHFGESLVAIEIDLHPPVPIDLRLKGALLGPIEPFHREHGQNATMTVIRVTSLSIDTLLARVTFEEQISPSVGALQIAHAGQVEFLAGDNFHEQCISVGPGLSPRFLTQLVRQGVIKGFYSCSEALRRWGLPNRLDSRSEDG